jgi:S1-C subfamily serine protease
MTEKAPSMLTPVQKTPPQVGSVARVKVSGKQFNWQKPYEKGDSYTAFGSASLISLPANLQTDQNAKEFYLLTAFHVVEDTELIWSTFPSVSGQEFKTVIVGCCPAMDIAILKIDDKVPTKVAQQVRRFTIGDSDALQSRQVVAAIGFPLHQETSTIVEGVLSGRQDANLQTTAPINPGNSGGPLIEVKNNTIIGVIVSGEEDAEGMNYAVPSRQILVHLASMLRQFTRLPSFNIETGRATPTLLTTLGCPKELSGAYVRLVRPDTPLHKAGMRNGDVLTGLIVNEYKEKYVAGFDENVKVPWWTSPVTIENIEQRLCLDESIEVEFWSTQRQTLQMERVQLSASDVRSVRYYYQQFEPVEYESFGGVVAMELTQNHLAADAEDGQWQLTFAFLTRQEPERLGEPVLVVTDVLADSSVRMLFNETISITDVITHVNGVAVRSLAEYRTALHKPQNGAIVWQTRDGMKTVIEYAVAQKEHAEHALPEATP